MSKPMGEMTMAEVEIWCRRHLPNSSCLSIDFWHNSFSNGHEVEVELWDGRKHHRIDPSRPLDENLNLLGKPTPTTFGGVE